MKKYRINTDVIDISWLIYRNVNIEEDFDSSDIVKDSIILSARNRRVSVELPFVFSDRNKVQIYFMADVQYSLGKYDLHLTYKVRDASVPGGLRTYQLDKCDAFKLVARNCDLEHPGPLEYEGVVENLRGYSAYEVWLKEGYVGSIDDYIVWLRKPAVDAAEVVSTAEADRIENEQGRIETEHLRTLAEAERVEAEQVRVAGEVMRDNAELLRASAEESRVELHVELQSLKLATDQARILAIAKASDAEDAAEIAMSKASDAEDAAQQAIAAANNWKKYW